MALVSNEKFEYDSISVQPTFRVLDLNSWSSASGLKFGSWCTSLRDTRNGGDIIQITETSGTTFPIRGFAYRSRLFYSKYRQKPLFRPIWGRSILVHVHVKIIDIIIIPNAWDVESADATPPLSTLTSPRIISLISRSGYRGAATARATRLAI